MPKIFDLIVVGAGAAGMTAAIYAKRYNLDVLMIGEKRGGTAVEAYKIENYPGFPEITGLELMEKFRAHAEKLAVPIKDHGVTKLTRTSNTFQVSLSNKEIFSCRTLVLALGTRRKKLEVPGETELTGKGVAYCATCDAPFFKNKTVAVVGGGDAATMASVLLTQYASKIYLLVRSEALNGEPIWIERATKHEKIEVIYQTEIRKVVGTKAVEAVELNKPYQAQKFLPVQGVFVEIGARPATELAKEFGVALNERWRIKVDNEQRTNLAGVFASGDVTDKTGHFEQVVNSAAQGAQAAYSAFLYLQDKNKEGKSDKLSEITCREKRGYCSEKK